MVSLANNYYDRKECQRCFALCFLRSIRIHVLSVADLLWSYKQTHTTYGVNIIIITLCSRRPRRFSVSHDLKSKRVSLESHYCCPVVIWRVKAVNAKSHQNAKASKLDVVSYLQGRLNKIRAWGVVLVLSANSANFLLTCSCIPG